MNSGFIVINSGFIVHSCTGIDTVLFCSKDFCSNPILKKIIIMVHDLAQNTAAATSFSTPLTAGDQGAGTGINGAIYSELGRNPSFKAAVKVNGSGDIDQ